MKKKIKRTRHYSKEGAPLRLASGLSGALLVDNTDEVVEDLVDVDLELGRGLDEEAVVEALGKLLTLLGGDNTHVVEIALVADKNHGDVVSVLDAEDLLAHVDQVVEGAEGDNRVHQHETLAVLHVQITHGRELLSTGSIEDLQHALLSVDLHLLAVAVLNSGIVLLDEDTLHELHRQRRLADTTRPKNNNLILLKRHDCGKEDKNLYRKGTTKEYVTKRKKREQQGNLGRCTRINRCPTHRERGATIYF